MLTGAAKYFERKSHDPAYKETYDMSRKIINLEQLVWDAHRLSVFETDKTFSASCWGCSWNTSPTWSCDDHPYDHDNDQSHPDCHDNCQTRDREVDEYFDTMDEVLHVYAVHVETLLKNAN